MIRNAIMFAAMGLAAGCTPRGAAPIAEAAPPTATSIAAGVADSLRATVGTEESGVGITDVLVDGSNVVAVFSIPIPGADASPAERQGIAGAIAGTFDAATCTESGIGNLTAAGGSLVIRAIGADGVVITEAPAQCA